MTGALPGRARQGAVVVVALVLGAVFAGALTRATFGFGEAVVSMPLLALLPISLHTSASLIGLAGLGVAALSMGVRSRQVDTRALARLCVGTALGVPVGILVLRMVPRPLASMVLGVCLVSYAGYSLLPRAERGRIGIRWAYPAGFAAGALGSAYNFNGVPVVVYGSLRRWSAAEFRGTLQAHFLFSGGLVVSAQAIGGVWTARLPLLLALSLPVLILATWVGHRLHNRISADRFQRLVYLLVLALGLILTGKGAVSA
ncbi:MAG TPA: sulfite exporter TauE/SafE family protein [Jatrophihabitans sp.]|nr:sulfite exporter TauE/SafE family protein [Jatrophihabitans sp.]